MKRILAVSLLFALCGLLAADPATPIGTMLRITDGIGNQYECISNRYNFGYGGTGDTTAADTTVQRGCWKNIRRVYESNDMGIAQLLPGLVNSMTQLDSQNQFAPWQNICWQLNSYYASVGGLNGHILAHTDSGRLSPRYAQVARASGIYLAPGAVFSDSLNFGSATVASGGAYAYSDTNAIDSARYGACVPAFKLGSISGTGSCSLLVWGSNQALTHGRHWAKAITEATTTIQALTAKSASTDSLYNIDSSKVNVYSGTLAATILFFNRKERADSL